jgi:hypothetical protein
MYNFTAPHIIEAIQNAIGPHNRQMILTLDRKSDDIGCGRMIAGRKGDEFGEPERPFQA